MSAINTFDFQNVMFLPRTGYACACMFAEETNPDGTRRLVRHWFKNETKV